VGWNDGTVKGGKVLKVLEIATRASQGILIQPNPGKERNALTAHHLTRENS
jgi:hypothetical protein